MDIKTIDCQQSSPEWHEARLGIVTCSELSKVLAKGEGKVRSKYMRQLAGEILTGKPAYHFQNDHMQRGKEEESEARECAALMFGEIKEVGFIRNDTLRLGCSPDGLLGEDGGIEIKSCLTDIQIERLKMLQKYPGWLPPEYKAQVEGSIIASGRSTWKFYSFSPGVPPLLVDVKVSDERRREIETELAVFNNELDQLVTEIKGMY